MQRERKRERREREREAMRFKGDRMKRGVEMRAVGKKRGREEVIIQSK
jgi:hypothetical protein